MTLDAGEAAIRTVIAAALAQHGKANGRGSERRRQIEWARRNVED
jgi:hypothetical protein